MHTARTLLVIGIHREELAFGREVVNGLQADGIDVLEIPEGLSGRRPLPDESFRYGVLHRALYLQLLPRVGRSHLLLIDLHSGFDELGPSADLLCADGALRARLGSELAAEHSSRLGDQVRVVPLGEPGTVKAHTVIPTQVWHNPDFAYLGIEVYLPDTTDGWTRGVALARRLVRIAAGCAGQRSPRTDGLRGQAS